MLGDVADVMWELATLAREALVSWVQSSPSFVIAHITELSRRIDAMQPNIVPERTKANFLQVIAEFVVALHSPPSLPGSSERRCSRPPSRRWPASSSTCAVCFYQRTVMATA